MEAEIRQKLMSYVDAFNEAKKHVHDDTIAAAIVEQLGRDRRTEIISGEKRNGFGNNENGTEKKVVSDEERATEKQLDYLKRLGVQFDDNVTRVEASRLIDQAKR